MTLDRVGLSVDDDVFELEVRNAGGIELLVLDGYVEILQQDIADIGLTRVWLDYAKGIEGTLDADDVQVSNHGFGRLHALKVKILRPRSHVDDAARWTFGSDVTEGDVLVMLGRVGPQFEGCDADTSSNFAVFRNDIADNRGLTTAGQNTAAALEGAIADANVLDGRAVLVLHGTRAFGAFAGDAVVGDREEAAIHGDVAGAVNIDAIGAGCLPVVVGHKEARILHKNAVVVVEMAIPELRILEGDAFDGDVFRAFDQRQPGARYAGIRKALVLGAILPEEFPDGHARSIENAVTGKLESVAVLGIDKGRGEVLHKVPFNAGALRRKVREIGGALEDGTFGEAQIHLRLEKECAGNEDSLGDNNGAATLGGKLIDSRLNSLGVNSGTVGDRA